MKRTGNVCAGVAALLLLGSAGSALAAGLPDLNLTLKPHMSAGKVDYVDVTMQEAAPEFKKGSTLLKFGLNVASVPTTRYDGKAITATDAKGALPMKPVDGPHLPYGQWRTWHAGRATSGDITYHFRAKPRNVDAGTKPGPMFDMRAQAGGMNASGMGFLPVPQDDRKYHISLHWDLSAMPAGARGIWSVGEGDQSVDGEASLLDSTYFAAGDVYSYPAKPDPKFGFYWFGKSPYDMKTLGPYVQKLYGYMSNYWAGHPDSYRVFLRKTPYWGANGTAGYKSFMFSYGGGLVQTTAEVKDLLSHEMTHNWPSLENNDGTNTWYEEGTAEYYSNLLSMRAGVITPQELVNRVNKRAVRYFTNPKQLAHLTMKQALKIFWQSSEAQRIPYGRGFMYFARLDSEIRHATHGKMEAADLVKTLYHREATGQSYGIADWMKLVKGVLGEKGIQEIQDLKAGKQIIPPKDAFGPCMSLVPAKMPVFELGFSEASLRGKKIVSGVTPDSLAGKAGLKNGDHVLRASNVSELMLSTSAHMKLTVKRNGKILHIDYLPRGKMVQGYRWKLNNPSGACHV